MAEKFGKTWWGNKWLMSLSDIDYENRIARGAAYAQKDMVRDIKIKGNEISAKVSGSRRTPYKIQISIPAFTKKQIDSFINTILKKPAIISKLLNRNLDPEILQIAEELNIKVFPSRWSDFQMNCSCPDWAVPCKHIAAVIYMISKEIDNNPFLIFEMHNLNLLEELRQRNIDLNEDKILSVPKLSELLIRKMPKDIKNDVEEFHNIDLSVLADISSPIAQVLPSSPVFYTNGDFKEKYANEFLAVVNKVRRTLQKDIQALAHPDYKTNTSLDKDNNIILSLHAEGNYSIASCFRHHDIHHNLLSLNNIDQALLNIDPDYLADYQANTKVLYQAFLCAIYFLAKGAAIPQILSVDKIYYIRWIPAYIDDNVKNIIESLDKMVPNRALDVYLPKKKLAVAIYNQAETIVSFFLTRLVSRFSRESANNDRFLSFFFKEYSERFDAIGETEIPGGIKSWLDHYHLNTSDYRIIILVEECSETMKFEVNIALEKKGKELDANIPLINVLTKKSYDKLRFDILKGVSLLSNMIPELTSYINSAGENKIIYDTKSIVPFLMNVIPAIKLLGVKVLLPKSLANLIRPKVGVRINKKQSSKSEELISIDDLLEFDWNIALGDENISAA